MDVIDLSHRIQEGMQIYPGDPVPLISPSLIHEKDYCHVDQLQLGSHTGTHIDAPYHFVPEGRRIDEIDAGSFMGYGVLVDVSAKADQQLILPEDLKPYAHEIQPGDFVIIRTGWDRFFGTDRYFQHPHLSAASAEYLYQCGVSIVAIDALSVDSSFSDAEGANFPVEGPESETATEYPAHDILMNHGILIVENLCRLDQIREVRGLYAFLPLKLADSDGSPIRAVFFAL